MKDARELALQMAEAISDGRPVDWESAEVKASPAAAAGLRLVDSIAAAHRSLRADLAAEDSEDLEETMQSPPAARPALRWGPLELREELGQGGFGEVWRAWDPQLQREVALKLRRPQAPGADPFARRFIEEARQLARVRHPNVAVVFGADEHDGREGLWTELVHGKDLDRCLHEQGPFSAPEATQIGIVLCQALAAVHAAGLVHRDVKTSNVMRETGGKILLMDFGSVCDLPGEGSESRGVSGTPLAMAPEGLQGEPLDRTGDLYSLGVLLYRLTSTRFPVEADSLSSLRDKHRRGERLHLRDLRPELPAQFIQVVERAVSPRREDRYQTAGAMESALSAALGLGAVTPQPLPAPPLAALPRSAPPAAPTRGRRPWIRATAAAGLAGVAVLLLWGWQQSGSVTDPGAGASPPTSVAVAPTRTEALAGVPAPAAFATEAAIFREGRAGEGGDIRLASGGRVQPGDRLFLEVESPDNAHVYVLNEDDSGRSYLLFPLSGFETTNPLEGGATHRLPGRLNGVQQSWVVTSAGGRERFLVVSAREPVPALESEIARATEAAPGRAIEMPAAAVRHLRGVGGIDAAVTQASPPSGRLAALAAGVAGIGGSAAGIQVRLFELENPAQPVPGS